MDGASESDPASLGSDYLLAVLAQVEVPIIVTDPDGRVQLVNAAWRGFHPEPPAGVPIGEWLAEFRFYDADGVLPIANDQAPLARVLRGDPVSGYEYSVQSKDGQIRHRRAYGQQLVDAGGQVIGAVVALHDTTEHKRAERVLRRLALRDGLTGLANRTLLHDRLDHALSRTDRDGGRLAVLLCDLDRFKWVNDAFGHSAGDALLVEVGTRVRALVRGSDTVARLGGDEFVIATELADELAAVDLADRVRAAISEDWVFGGIVHRPTVSIGIAVACEGSASVEELLRDADTAMYRAKGDGGDGVAFFDDAMRAAAVRRAEVRQRIEQALTDDGFRLRYQPIVAVDTERIVGFEALVRLRDADDCGPDEFVPVAEEAGLVHRIDRWGLSEALAQLARWDDTADDPPLTMSCNVSARTLGSHALIEELLNALDRTGIAASRLRLELTETAVLRADEMARAQLARLRCIGVAIGLDDFGTGFSPLTHLQTLPISFIKIDRSFTSGLDEGDGESAIVDASVRMASALGLGVVAEGVETGAQAAILRDMGCPLVQGYLYAPPLTASAAADLLARQRAGDAPLRRLGRGKAARAG